MNYQALKWLIESIKKDFRCPECKSSIDESSIDIIWAAWNSVNVDIICKKCGKHSMLSSQLLMIDLKSLTNSLWKKNITNNSKKNIISDNEIINLNKDLNNWDIKVSDLFN